MRSLLPLVATVAASLLAAPGVAGAAVTPGDYGGGWIASKGSKPGYMPLHADVVARVGADGRASVTARAVLACAIPMLRGRVAVAADGSFSLSRRWRARGPGPDSVGRVELAGRFDGTVATGTIETQARSRRASGRVTRCGTPRPRPWKMHLRPAPAGSAPAQPGATYFGLTGDRSGPPHPFVLRPATDRARVDAAYFTYTQICDGKRRGTMGWEFPGGALAPDGTFVGRERWVGHRADGSVDRFLARMEGHFTPGGVTGTLRVTMERERRGRVVRRCDSGTQTFGALL